MNLRRLLAWLIIPVCMARASAVWHDTPVRVDAGRHVIGTLGNVDRATIHVRLAADSRDCRQWGIIWNFTDEANYTKATLTLPPDGRQSELYATQASVDVVTCTGGVTREVCSRMLTDAIADGKEMNSLKLVFDGGRATLYAGSTDQKEVCQVPFGNRGGVTAFFCDSPVRVQRVDVRSHASAAPCGSGFSSLDQLAGHIRSSSDPMEGFWEYLDRSNDPAKAVPGGTYTLATVRNGDAYDIIYVKGAEVASGSWQPLQVKGRLKPTIFRGNYDMEWITADMQRITDDTDAQLSEDGALLTLRFPLLGTQIRMRRLPL